MLYILNLGRAGTSENIAFLIKEIYVQNVVVRGLVDNNTHSLGINVGLRNTFCVVTCISCNKC
jgi:hypothetical protein